MNTTDRMKNYRQELRDIARFEQLNLICGSIVLVLAIVFTVGYRLFA